MIRESPCTFRPRAGHYFAANRLPGTNDQTDGFWRRFIVLKFNRSFKGDPGRDPAVSSKLLAERPAIVCWLIDGAKGLIDAREYTIPNSHEAALSEWRRNADHIALFVESETRPVLADESTTAGVSATQLYTTYRAWAQANGHRAEASNKFGVRMRELGFGARHTRHGNRYPVTLGQSEEPSVTDREEQVTESGSRTSRGVTHA